MLLVVYYVLFVVCSCRLLAYLFVCLCLVLVVVCHSPWFVSSLFDVAYCLVFGVCCLLFVGR